MIIPRFSFFAMLLLLLIVILAPQAISLSVIAVLGGVGVVMFFFSKSGVVDKKVSVLLLALVYCVFISLLNYESAASFDIFVAESKIIVILLFCFLFLYIKPGFCRGRDCVPIVSLFFLLLNALLFFSSGFSFRYIDADVGGSVNSIYMSFVLAIIFVYDRNSVRRLLLFVFVLFLGSATGLVVLFFTFLYLYRTRIRGVRFFVFVLVSTVFVFGFYYYNLEYRQRDLFDFSAVDRFQLLSAGLLNAYYEHGFFEVFFGYGVARPLETVWFYFDYSLSTSVVPWLNARRAVDGFTGLVFHNEFLRLYYNFGLFGCFLVFYVFYLILDNKALFFGVLVASVFGSVLYINMMVFFVLFYDLLVDDCAIRRGS